MSALGNKMILDISKNNRDLIERLKSSGILGFKSLDNKDIFKFACALGLSDPTDFKNKDTYLRTEFLSSADKALLLVTKLGTAKTSDEVDMYCNIDYLEVERCANTGFDILRKIVDECNDDNELIALRMLYLLDTLYEKNVR